MEAGDQLPSGVDLTYADPVEEKGGPCIFRECRCLSKTTSPIGTPLSGPEKTDGENRAGYQGPDGVEKIVTSLHSQLQNLRCGFSSCMP